ncbi:MAG: hypothetical protein NC341_05110 [Blautia sp.]|nr:hypothetical protein [Blautia sp.]MCM1199674.1 hypothetical protein [Bacteroides fragilis]
MNGNDRFYDLSGLWQADIGDGKRYPVRLPGTLDESGIGYPDRRNGQVHPDEALGNHEADGNDAPDRNAAEAPIATRFTRKHTYEGAARFSRSLCFEEPSGKRIFLEAERARCLRLLIDGKEVPAVSPATLCTPYVFEVTGMLGGTHELTLVSDNSYPGLPHDAIVYSSAATDETQTNWNGVLGYLRLRAEKAVFPAAVRVYPKGERLTVKAELWAAGSWEGTVFVRSEALKAPAQAPVKIEGNGNRTGGEEEADKAGRIKKEIVLEALPLKEGVKRWDEGEGNLYELSVTLSNGASGTAVFGVRDFGADGAGRLTLNGRRFFLRGEANCAVFPETGYPPMTAEAWKDILRMYRSYGINCMRFHSHCPPEAAFTAADELGMMMQPELSHWNPRDAFESEESYAYYRAELAGILRMLANHPSFVMLTLGNELHALPKGHERMDALLAMARATDGTRLYANGSNVHYGETGCDKESDFYTSSSFYDKELRGTFADMKGYLNHSYPNAATSFDGTMEALRETYAGPVFSFEAGQFEILPDFAELAEFQGISDPANLRMIRRKVKERGMEADWRRYVEASGELSRLCYREEIEAAMRTEQLSGISLLGLQDFPGQGTALVGMLNSHLEPKPYAFADPAAFREFFTDRLPLVLLPKYTYENTEPLRAEVKVANFGKETLTGRLRCELREAPGGGMRGREREEAHERSFLEEIRSEEEIVCPPGKLTRAGSLEFSLKRIDRPARLQLTVSLCGISNRYPLWVYPPVCPVCPEGILETEHMDEEAASVLQAGGTVYLTPPSTKEALPHSIQAQFSTDFWSVGTFPNQEGGMGQLIDAEHPIFRDFPTEFYSSWQWWPMAGQRAVILPERYDAIIAEMDSYAFLRPMAKLFECRCGNGKLLFSTLNLQNLQQYPEARALLYSIYRYLDSTEFEPGQEIGMEAIRGLVR